MTLDYGDNRLRFYDLESGRERGASATGHGGMIANLCFSSDGTLLVSSASDRTVRSWEVASGAPKLVIRTDDFRSLAVSPDEQTIATSGVWDDTVRLWKASTGEEIRALDLGGVRGVGLWLESRRLWEPGERQVDCKWRSVGLRFRPMVARCPRSVMFRESKSAGGLGRSTTASKLWRMTSTRNRILAIGPAANHPIPRWARHFRQMASS